MAGSLIETLLILACKDCSRCASQLKTLAMNESNMILGTVLLTNEGLSIA